MATEITMQDLLQATIDEGASDLHVRAFMPPELRVHGELVAIADEAFTEEDTYKLCHDMMTPEQSAEVEKNGGADFALAHEDGTRFRVSVFKERKRWGFGVGVQGGYGFTPKGWQPYVGVGVSFGYSF